MLLMARDVVMAFQGLVAVDGVSLEVREGEIVGLIGPNGAGKSTLFNCLSGDLAPTRGSVQFDGVDVTRLSPDAHARLGMARTYQIPLIFDNMSVLENVMVGAFLRHRSPRKAREVAWDALEQTGLAHRAAAWPGSLGTAGRKRLEIARALATRPRLLLLDEAMAGLTPAEAEEAVHLVRAIHARGVTLVIVEHVMEVIMHLAQRLVVLHEGRVIASGRPQEVVRLPQVVTAYLGRRVGGLNR